MTAKLFLLTVILVVTIGLIHGNIHEERRPKRMNHDDTFADDDDLNVIDHGGKTGSKHVKPQAEVANEETVYPKKMSHKKKSGHKERKPGNDEDHLLGHRGEQEWRERDGGERRKLRKKSKQRLDPTEDLHLQDLSYKEEPKHQLDQERKFGEKKHKKEKNYNKEKKMNKEKEQKKKQKNKKDKDRKHKKEKFAKESEFKDQSP